jgi:hypothetical protein
MRVTFLNACSGLRRLMMPSVGFSVFFTALVLPGIFPAALPGQTTIIGSWHGTSTCADKVAFPACHDEEVIYDVAGISGSDSVTLRADKVVGGQREFMGEFTFGSSHPGEWQAAVGSARFHGRMTLTIVRDTMTGALVDIPTSKVVRQVALRRVKT